VPAQNTLRTRHLAVAEPGDAGAAAAVLRAVLDHGPIPRTLIGRTTGLSPAAVTRQTAGLISFGLVRELPAPPGPPRAGRPVVPLDIDTERYLACGVHIAVPIVTFGLVDLRGRVVARESHPHGGDAPSVVRLIGRLLPDFVRRHSRGSRLLGLGVVTGGRVDPERGVVLEHGPLGWHDVDLRHDIAAAIGVPASGGAPDFSSRRFWPAGLPVHVDGHARALAHAEILFGRRRARRSHVHLFVGNVVDAAIATAGVVHRGQHSSAGDIAHLEFGAQPALGECGCGRTGCFQAAVSDRALLARAVRERVIARPDLADLLAAAVGGEARAVSLFRDRLRVIGRVVALLLDIFDPDDLVLTEAAAITLPWLLPALYEEIAKHSRGRVDPERIVRPNSFGSGTLAVAAGATVLHAVYRAPHSRALARSAG
jgi:predicted NBD/HSP70 family sugar kinase